MDVFHATNESQEHENDSTKTSFDDREATLDTHSVSTATAETSASSVVTYINDEQSTRISELQDALGVLLLARREKGTAIVCANSTMQRSNRRQQPVEKSPIMPKWTGSFALFSFPRELRDRIYYYYLYLPQGIVYRRNTAQSFPFDDRPHTTTSLFLTSRQVYHEAWQVFCRCNQVRLPARQDWHHQRLSFKSLDGTMRVFPEKPAASLQRISISFQQYMYMYHARSSRDALSPGAAFVQMLRDAYTVKFTFPKLREYIVCFEQYHDFFGISSSMFEIEGADEEEKIQRSLGIMKEWVDGSNVIPPSWLVLHFDANWRFEHLKKQKGIWNAAYKRLVRECAGKSDDLEDSGKKWIEETWNFEKKKKTERWKNMPRAPG